MGLSTNVEELLLYGSGDLYGAEYDVGMTIMNLKVKDDQYMTNGCDTANWYCYQGYKYAGCLLESVLEPFKIVDNSQTEVLAVYAGDSYEIIPFYVNASAKFRIWDFAGRDCHASIYGNQDFLYPVGKGLQGGGGVQAVAIYVEPGFDFTDMIMPSEPNTLEEDPSNSIDILFKDYVKVKLSPEDIIINFDDGDLEIVQPGKYKCIEQCRIFGALLDLAIVSKDVCYCINYSTLEDKVLKLNDEPDSPCPDNASMDCGTEEYVTIYHINQTEFSQNQGYNYWQTIQYPTYNGYSKDQYMEVPHALKTFSTPSQCLSFCKDSSEYEIAIIRNVEADEFECFCMYPQFYKFTIQDVTSKDGSATKYWCPDLHGPCSKAGYQYSVVYCMGDSCSTDLFLNPKEFDICNNGTQVAHPKKLSQYYYECTKNSSIHYYYTKMTCPDGEVFQQQECQDIKLPHCINSTTHCICDDDDGVRWKVPRGENGEKSCRLHNEDYEGIHENKVHFENSIESCT